MENEEASMLKLRPWLTYANVASTICLFIVLGGGAYAAATLPKNSAGTKQMATETKAMIQSIA